MTSVDPLAERMPRLDALTGMRWWAAFFVFTYHMIVFAPLPGMLNVFFDQGFLGVNFFFVLSGFVLTWSASNRVSQSTFYWRRFARIYPAHVVALLMAIPVFYSFDPNPAQTWVKPVSVGILLLSFVLLQGWSNAPGILFSGNPAAWTLTCEAFFYALHPYLGKILTPLRQRGSIVFVVVWIIIAFAYRALAAAFPDQWFAALPLPVVRLTEFAIGMGLAWALRRGLRVRLPVAVGLGSLVLALALIVIATRFFPGTAVGVVVGTFSKEIFTVACAVAVLAIASRGLEGKPSLLAHPVLVKLGEWSFAFYLVHATLIYTAFALFGLQQPSWWNLLWFALLFVVALATAAVLHQFVERPVEKRMRAWKDSRAALRAAPTG
jgi:peptidoglycan/LPS O-acetylase OafA/YrhL